MPTTEGPLSSPEGGPLHCVLPSSLIVACLHVSFYGASGICVSVAQVLYQAVEVRSIGGGRFVMLM